MIRVALLFVLGLGLAHGAVAPALDVEALTLRADRVVEGRVLSVRTLRLGGFLVTEAEVEVVVCHKGPCVARLQVQTLGGRAGGVRELVVGAAGLAPDEEVVLFLRGRSGADAFVPVGMAQGKFRVTRLAGLALASRTLAGLDLVGDGADRARADAGLDLAALVARIERAQR